MSSFLFLFLIEEIKKKFFFFGCTGSLSLCAGFPLAAVSRSHSPVACVGSPLQWLPGAERRLWELGLQ